MSSSTNSLSFPDANVWLALMCEGHTHFPTARAWFEAGEEPLLFCRFTQMAVLRLLTTARVMGPEVCSMARAWRAWDEMTADPRISFIAEPVGLEGEFRALSRLDTASPKVWADAYLLAFAEASGLVLVTLDRALAARSSSVRAL